MEIFFSEKFNVVPEKECLLSSSTGAGGAFDLSDPDIYCTNEVTAY